MHSHSFPTSNIYLYLHPHLISTSTYTCNIQCPCLQPISTFTFISNIDIYIHIHTQHLHLHLYLVYIYNIIHGPLFVFSYHHFSGFDLFIFKENFFLLYYILYSLYIAMWFIDFCIYWPTGGFPAPVGEKIAPIKHTPCVRHCPEKFSHTILFNICYLLILFLPLPHCAPATLACFECLKYTSLFSL